MADTFPCPACGKSLKLIPEMVGRKVRCPRCESRFPMGPDGPIGSGGGGTADPDANLSDEMPVLRDSGKVRRDDTLSRSMLPGPMAPVVPSDEMLGRVEPETLRWITATEALEEFLGQNSEQLRRRRFPDLLHPDDRALAVDEFRKAAERGERHDFVLRFPEASGRMRFVRVYTQARYNADGTLNHIRCYLKDVTERVQAEQELRRRTEQLTTANEQLRQANDRLKQAQGQLVHTEKLASLGTLAAGMAHEINNPLAFAMNNVAVMGRDVRDLIRLLRLYREGLSALKSHLPDLAARVEQLESEIEVDYLRDNLPSMADATRNGLARVAKIVENLRGFAQVDRPEMAIIDVNEALENSLAMLGDALAQGQVAVDRDYSAIPALECAAAPLNQVFLNLLMNAFQAVQDARPGAGRIGVRTELHDGQIVVEVSDNGCGIPAEIVSRIFDPFFTTKPIGRGTGLGLSISHGIVADHGGRIEVESAVGKGSVFRVRLPVDRSRTESAAPV